jgi:hypothetical protein
MPQGAHPLEPAHPVLLHLKNDITFTPLSLKTGWKVQTVTKANEFIGDAEGTGASAYVSVEMPEGWQRFGASSATKLTAEGQIYFEGSLLGKTGSFVIAAYRGRMADKVTAEWEIVPGSGTWVGGVVGLTAAASSLGSTGRGRTTPSRRSRRASARWRSSLPRGTASGARSGLEGF